jgi:2,4-dienoyl-CoA reductase (NADPH2)
MAYPYLFRPGRIGPLRLGSRLLMGSMHLGLEGPEADVERIARFYAERARGGVALVVTGGAAVSPEGGGERYSCLAEPGQLGLYARIAERVHAEGAPVALQLFHAGRYTRRSETGLRPVAPSEVPSPIFPDLPRSPSSDEVWELVGAFGRGARVARELGYDAVEVMGSEGYLINQFLSPLTNRREDAWGGDLEGRMRFGLEVARAVRAEAGPGLAVVFRLSGADLVDGSTTWEETAEFARRLAACGVGALNVGVGWHESRVPTVGMLVPRGAFAFAARRVREAVGAAVPVIAANRINTPEVAERVLASGAADFVGLARPLLADPAFAAKARAGRADRINTCIACNQACLDHVLDVPPRPASCLVNPAAGREAEFELLPARRRLRVAVAGGGPAGLEAARVLGERGHAVTLFEREPELGGQLRLARRVPGKFEFGETLRYYRVELARLGVRVELGAAPSADDLAGGFDRVVCATGVRPRVPSPEELPGVDLPHVLTYPDVLLGRAAVGERVAIVGGGGIACDLAHFLTEQGPADPEAAAFLAQRGVLPPDEAVAQTCGRRLVTLMRRGGRIAPSLGRTTRWALLATLRARGVEMLTGIAYRAIEADGVRIERAGREELVPADTVVLACGQEPVSELARALEGRVPCRVIGGARLAAELDAKRAIQEAALVGREL